MDSKKKDDERKRKRSESDERHKKKKDKSEKKKKDKSEKKHKKKSKRDDSSERSRSRSTEKRLSKRDEERKVEEVPIRFTIEQKETDPSRPPPPKKEDKTPRLKNPYTTADPFMIEVVVNDRCGRKVRVKCSPNDSIGDLKKLVAAQTGTRPERIRIQKGYSIFKDHISLKDYEINDGMGLEMYYN
eukprot:TRINITY_DN7796_c0_g2_i6.p2 TRINITY_DN7796_c0_g2~~TRINITY_DN7796_c0_g2_i6.p2  ORF type:complete len:186 (+),score=57.03 TRINITY_DN7796_c0_g2_i6:91-648(+)